MNGFFLIYRNWMANTVFKAEPLTEREAWLWLIENACFHPTPRRIGGREVELARGQLSHSTRFLADRWQWSEASVRRFLRKLKAAAMIDADNDASQGIITICNYTHYQDRGQSSDADIDAVSDAGMTQKRRGNDAKNKEGKEGISPSPSLRSGEPPVNGHVVVALPEKPNPRGTRLRPDWSLPHDWRDWAQRMGLVEIDREAEKFRLYWIARPGEKARKVDWSATWQTWVRKHLEERGHGSGHRTSEQRVGMLGAAADLTGVPEDFGAAGLR